MHTTSPNKRARLLELLEISTHAQMQPLEDSTLLRLVFSHLPPSYLFLGSVSRLWRDALHKSECTKTTSWRTALHSQQSLVFACPQGALFERKRWHDDMCREEWEERWCNIGRELGKCGSKDMIRWALLRESRIHKNVCVGAASGGRADVLEWLFSRKADHFWQHSGVGKCMIESASNASTLAAFKCVWSWVWRRHLKSAHKDDCTCGNSSNGCTCSSSDVDRDSLINGYAGAAVLAGLPEAFVWILDKATSQTSERPYQRWINTAARAGHIPMLQCIREQSDFPAECYHTQFDDGSIWYNGAVYEALTDHHVTAVEWLLDNGFTMNGDDMLSLTVSDLEDDSSHIHDLPMLKLLHSRGIGGTDGVWSDDTYRTVMMHAGVKDELELLQWARQHAPTVWPDQLWEPSWRGSSMRPINCWSLQCLQWAISQGCPWGVWTEDVCRTAADVKVVSDNAMIEAAQQSRRAWAHANGCPCSCAR
eukprot:15733-Heterococcus_DN1.PRE.2